MWLFILSVSIIMQISMLWRPVITLTDVTRQDVSEYKTAFAMIVHHFGEITGLF